MNWPKQGKRKVLPCSCENGSKDSTYIEKNLSGYVWKISCFECGEEVDYNNYDDVVAGWNMEQKGIKKKWN